MLTRRRLLGGTAAAAMLVTAAGQARADSKPKTLRIIHASDLRSLDPIWTTAPPTKDYAFLTFDQLIAVDANFVPRPQMAEGWSVEDNGRSVVIDLREGLKFHDGLPVRSQDCVASIARWSARDGFGQGLHRVTDVMQVIDDRRFRIRLKQPFPLLPDAIGKSSSSQCFIMPERMANTDPMKQVTEWIGSGPYRFLHDEWVPGAKVAWARFEDYAPRAEPVSGIAGGRIAAVDRVEWTILGDAATALATLQSGEQDYWDAKLGPDPGDPGVAGPGGARAQYLRQLPHAAVQPSATPVQRSGDLPGRGDGHRSAGVPAGGGRTPRHDPPCESYFACGTAYGSDAGADVLKTRSIERAAAALKATNYAGEKVVILAVTESQALFAMAQVADDILRKIGMTTDLVATDFATMAERRTNRGSVDKGGWSIFVTVWTGTDILNPAVNQMLRGAGAAGWFGWPTDETLEDLRTRWFVTADPAEQAKIATQIQIEAFKSLPYIPLGATTSYVAYNKAPTGVFDAPVSAFWNIGKPG